MDQHVEKAWALQWIDDETLATDFEGNLIIFESVGDAVDFERVAFRGRCYVVEVEVKVIQ